MFNQLKYFNRVFFSNDGGIDTFTFPPPLSFLLHHLFELQFEITSGAIVGSSLLAAGLEKQGNNSHLDPLTKLDYIFLLSGWSLQTSFMYQWPPEKILPSHRLKNLTIVPVDTSLALGTTSCINTTRTNSTTVYTIWGIYGTSEKVRQLPTFFCCHCFSWCSVKNACSFVNDYEYFSRREESGA